MYLVIVSIVAAFVLAVVAVIAAIVVNSTESSPKTNRRAAWITIFGFAGAALCLIIAVMAANPGNIEPSMNQVFNKVIAIMFAVAIAWLMSLEAIRVLRQPRKNSPAT